MVVNVNLSGEGIEFEREVSESAALRIMEISMSNGATADDEREGQAGRGAEESTGAAGDEGTLPNNFFSRLSAKQEALLRVLNDAEEPISSSEMQRRMEAEYDETVGGGRGVAGILQGFTKKYGDEFKIITIEWGGNEGYYQLNPDRPEYIREIDEHFSD